jgi:hypothetical protein
MKLRIPFALLAAVAIASFAGGDTASAAEAITDGGFENSEFNPSTGSEPAIGRWDSSRDVEGSFAGAVESPVLSGTFAAQVDTRSVDFGRSIFQDLEGTTPCFTWTFNVYRGEGVNWVELINARAGGGVANPVSLVILSDTAIEFRAWGTATSLSQPLSPDTWHEIVVEADAPNLVQTFSIDGEVAAQVPTETAEFAPETIFMGDVGSAALHGLYTYDDVSLDSRECDGDEPSSSTDAEETPADQPASTDADETPEAGGETAPQQAGDDDGSSFPWWLIVLIVILVLAFLLWFLYWRRRKSQEENA